MKNSAGAPQPIYAFTDEDQANVAAIFNDPRGFAAAEKIRAAIEGDESLAKLFHHAAVAKAAAWHRRAAIRTGFMQTAMPIVYAVRTIDPVSRQERAEQRKALEKTLLGFKARHEAGQFNVPSPEQSIQQAREIVETADNLSRYFLAKNVAEDVKRHAPEGQEQATVARDIRHSLYKTIARATLLFGL